MRRGGVIGGGWVVVVVAAAAAYLPLSGVATATPVDAAASPSQVRVAFSSFPDYLDPQLSYTYEGWTAMYDTYIPLLTFRHAAGKAGSEVVPGLAEALPEVTNGGRTYTLFLRKGLKYSDGRPVEASDFEFAIKRMFRLFSGGSVFYADIVGARKFLRTKRGGISGIAANDETGKIVIRLVKPRNDFTDALALMFAAPVPPGTPASDQSGDPPAATGPYAISSSTPGLGWSYVRNPEWEANNAMLMPGIPSGHVDAIHIAVIRNTFTQVTKVKRGKLDLMLGQPPVPLVQELERRYRGTQFQTEPTLSTYYFWMNTRRAPFNDLRVRQAVNYALRPSVIRAIYAGGLAPTQQILPPGMPGYRKLELYPHNMAKARRLIAQAHPSDREITVWTSNESPNEEATEYYAGVLRQLGFRTHLKAVNAYNYFTVVSNRRTPDLDTGFSNWYEDYPHPNDFFQPLFSGASIHQIDNGNLSQISVPSLNEKIARLDEQPGAIPDRGYAALDRAYMKLAAVAPLGNRMLSIFVSRAIDLDKLVWNPTFGTDLTSLQFR